MASLTDPWMLGPLEVPNRVLLAPLAGIGNWFVRLQAKRYGAGMAVSEMVSSHAIHYGNAKTCGEMLRIDPRERGAWRAEDPRGGDPHGGDPRGRDWCGGDPHEGDWRGEDIAEGARGGVRPGGPVSIQLFGEDPAIMRSAAAHVAAWTAADAIDINMGCPVPKVRKTGAGAAMLADPALAIAIVRAARAGTADGGRELPVTVKLRSGLRPGESSGYELAHRLVIEGGAAAIAFHPRSAAVHHKGVPDYALAARLVATLPAPVILTGGLHDAPSTLAAWEQTGAAAVMLARGALGNPWLFRELLDGGGDGGAGGDGDGGGGVEGGGDVEGGDVEGGGDDDGGGGDEPARTPTREEVLSELDWTTARAIEHLGEPRASRYLRKFYPWYVERLGLDRARERALCESLQRAETLQEARYTARLAALPGAAIPA